MKTKIINTIVAILCLSSVVNAQTLGDFKPGKSGPSSLSKSKFDNKTIYIADFAVHYQVYSEESSAKKGGSGLMGKVMGATKASLAVGLDIPEESLQDITNNAYANFIASLEAEGYTLLNGDAAKGTDFYKDYKYSTNLTMSPSNTMEGAVTVHPQNVGFFYKEKGSNVNTTKLSSELNDAVVVRIDLFVEFVKSSGSSKSGIGSSVVAKTNLVLTDNNTIVHFIVGRNKIGGSPLAEYQGIIKKDFDIDGVIKEEKISSFSQADYDNWGTSTAFGTVYSAENRSKSKVALVSADAEKYEAGVELAIDTFLKHHLNEFTNKFF